MAEINFEKMAENIIKSLREKGFFVSRWVPVSEKLPKKDGRYLAYIINPFDDKLRYIMTCEYFVGDCHGWCPDDECSSNNVVAWMPLPEQYKIEPQESEVQDAPTIIEADKESEE